MPVTLTVVPGVAEPALPRRKWTRNDCEALIRSGIDELKRYELIEGELIEKVSKNLPHILVLKALVDWLYQVFSTQLVIQEPTINVAPRDTPTSAPEPDAIVLTHRAKELSSLPRPEEIQLAVEVSDSRLGFDLTTKAALYARAPIREYWVVDINARRIIVHRDPLDGKYQSRVAYSEGEAVSALGAPDSLLNVSDLF